LQYNTDYSVNIRAINTLDGTIGPWVNNGCVLRFGAPMSPNNNICNLTLTTSKTSIWCTNIGGATQYRVRVNGNVHVINQNNVRLYNLGYKAAGVYNVEWSAFAGGSWTAYGNNCPITVSTTSLRIANTDIEEEDNTSNSYIIQDELHIEDISKIDYKLVDINGRKVDHTVNDDKLKLYSSGVYFLITENEKIKIVKID
jgi:hypothetical protein